jgi:hypothetical protein
MGGSISLLLEFHPLFSGTQIIVGDAEAAEEELEGHD